MVLLRMLLTELPTPERSGHAFASTIGGDMFSCSRYDLRAFHKQLREWRGQEGVDAKREEIPD